MAEGETARQLSFSMEGDAVPDHADVRQLLKQVEQQQAMLASASMVKALDGAEPLAYAQACTRIKDEFSRLKLQLLEQETKKRLLEHLLSKGAKAGSQDSFAEAQMNERKATAKRAKAEGKALREKIAEHARAIAQLKRQIAEEGAALARSADSLAENAEQETAARAQLVATTAELEAVERALATEEQNATLAEEELARLRAQSERDADRRRQLREQIEATRAGVAEAEAELGRRLEEASSLQRASTDAETHQHVCEQLSALGGVRFISMEDAADGGCSLRLELRAPKGAAHEGAHELAAAFDLDGRLTGGVQLIPASVGVADLGAVAAESNSLQLLVRETMSRLCAGRADDAAALSVCPVPAPVRERLEVADAAEVPAGSSADSAPGEKGANPSVVAAAAVLPAGTRQSAPAAGRTDTAPHPPAAAPATAPSTAARGEQPPSPPAPAPSAAAQSMAAAADHVQASPAVALAELPAAAVAAASHSVVAEAVAGSCAPAAAAPAGTADGGAAEPAPKRRKSSTTRKSFSRKSLDPLELKRVLGPAHSPCGRTEKAGVGADPKSAILGLQAVKPETMFTVYTADGSLHGTFLSDGSFLDAGGSVKAYIEQDGSVGSAAMEYLGEVSVATTFITDADEQHIATMDLGRGAVRDVQGSTIAEWDQTGRVKGHRGMTCGRIDGFSYALQHVAAALVTIVSPEFVRGY